MTSSPPLSLGSERIVALETAFGILREAWEGFDTARPGQPPPSEHTLALLSEDLPGGGVGVLTALREAEALLVAPRGAGYLAREGGTAVPGAVVEDTSATLRTLRVAASACNAGGKVPR